jgi:hypothetical protein
MVEDIMKNKELDEVRNQFMKTNVHIFPILGLPFVDESPERRQGLCLHHSYVPELPQPDRNYAEIFNKFHFGRIEDWKKINGQWVNPEGSWYGLRYDFVVSWLAVGSRSNTQAQVWTSYRWAAQLGGGHSRNPKQKKWADGRIIKPNSELVSVCVVGNYDKYIMPGDVIAKIREIAKFTDCREELFFHSDFDFKTCPGSKTNYLDLKTKIFGSQIRRDI